MSRSPFVLAAALLLGASCESDIPDEQPGLHISGTVGYTGHAHDAFARPAIIVALFAEFPPKSPPRGIVTLEQRDLTGPLSYEIIGVPSGKYKIVGQVVDLAVPAPETSPSGSFPNFCILFAPVNNIEVKEDSATADVNFTVYDRDPCIRPPTPDAGPPDAGSTEPDAAPVEPDASM